MEPYDPAGADADPRLPSGPWTGFFLQSWLPGRHPTSLHLTCRGGSLTGAGRDRVGAYTVAGTYDPATGRCAWTKQYLGKHAVAYRGVADGAGVWGVWEITQLGGLLTDRGGFHLWPEGADVSAEAARTEAAVLAAMRAEFGGPVPRAALGLVAAGAAAALALLAWRGLGY